MGIESVLLPVVGTSVAKLLLKKYLASSEVAQIFGVALGRTYLAPVARPARHEGSRLVALGRSHLAPVA